jgi:RHS repeat-associated protein
VDEILMRTDTTRAVTYYYRQDHEGSVTHLTNAAGTVIEKYRYDAFGAPTVYDGSGNLRPGGTIYKTRFLFTGREYAATFGFYEYRARAYHPKLGRFTSEDPKLFDAGDYNLFRYCHNDPLDLTDPMGLETNWSGAGPQNPQNHAAIARLAEIRDLRELTGAGGAISTGMLNYQIGQLQQAIGSFMTGQNSHTGEARATQTIATARDKKAAAVLDAWSSWPQANRKEMAGTFNSSGQVNVGPERLRTATTSHPGPITADTVATWHYHLLVPGTHHIGFPNLRTGMILQ